MVAFTEAPESILYFILAAISAINLLRLPLVGSWSITSIPPPRGAD